MRAVAAVRSQFGPAERGRVVDDADQCCRIFFLVLHNKLVHSKFHFIILWTALEVPCNNIRKFQMAEKEETSEPKKDEDDDLDALLDSK